MKLNKKLLATGILSATLIAGNALARFPHRRRPSSVTRLRQWALRKRVTGAQFQPGMAV